jgi:BirA family biotin operon repressor/biotin-[acetyl-CoA-carboxylase] ligase
MTTNKNLLRYLKGEKGEWVSGEQLSNKLEISRTAVWKHIHKLRDKGYVIESSTKKGYRLQEISDLLLADEIREGLNTQIFAQKDILHYKETDSTNTVAKDLAVRGAPEGTLVVAEKQTRGKGRRGRTWFSPAGSGIYASLILRPVISPGEAPRITLMTAVAVAEALLALIPLAFKIKWPNDILVNGKKIAGILTEISTEMDSVDYIVVGLGLNVNTPKGNFTQDIREKATSILVETGKPFSRIKLLQACLQWYELYYERFQKGEFAPILDRWKELADIIGQLITVDMAGKMYSGKVMDVDNDGILILKDDEDKTHRIFSGDVTLLT